jgi:mannitol-specific phosphotransferase system IIBC component
VDWVCPLTPLETSPTIDLWAWPSPGSVVHLLHQRAAQELNFVARGATASVQMSKVLSLTVSATLLGASQSRTALRTEGGTCDGEQAHLTSVF